MNHTPSSVASRVALLAFVAAACADVPPLHAQFRIPRTTFDPVAQSAGFDPPVPRLVDFGCALSAGVDPDGRGWIVVQAREAETRETWLCLYWAHNGKFFRALPAARAERFADAATSFDVLHSDVPAPYWLSAAARAAIIGDETHGHDDECRVARLFRDANGDGREDLAVARWDGTTTTAHIELRSGTDGVVLASSSFCDADHFGHALATGRDVDGDGIGDIAVGQPDLWAAAGRSCVRLFSGVDLRLLRVIPELFGGGYVEGFGASVALVRDLDGDGGADVLVGCWEDGDQGDDYYAAAFNGRTGAELGMTRTAQCFVHVAALDQDFDEDGKDEFLLGLPEREEVWIVRGRAALGELDVFGHRGKHDWTPRNVLLPPKPEHRRLR